MNIQEYSEIISLIAKIEEKKAAFEKTNNEFEGIDSIKETERWMEVYAKKTKEGKALQKAYSNFRKKFDNEEYSHLSYMFRYSTDKSDKNFYYYTSRHVLYKVSQDIKFEGEE